MDTFSLCPVCGSSNNKNDPLHNNTAEHAFNFRLYSWTRYRKALVKNRDGVVVEVNPAQANVEYKIEERKGKHIMTMTPDQFVAFGNKVFFSCMVKNIRKNSEIYLTSAFVMVPYSWFSLRDPKLHINNGKLLKIQPGNQYEVFVEFNSGDQAVVGSYKIPIAFNFQDAEEYAFTIARSIIVRIEKEVFEERKENSPFTNNEWPKGIKINYPTQKQKYYDRYIIPQEYFNYIYYGLRDFHGMRSEDYTKLDHLRQQIKELNSENYQLFWHILLWLEEMAQKFMLQKYNMEKVWLKVMKNGMLELEVPGLAEKRPSVITNDMIDIKLHDETDQCYRGIIKKVNDKTVEIAYLKDEIMDEIRKCPDIPVDVRFVLSRLNLERMHQGIDQVVLQKRARCLFPSGVLPITLPLKYHIEGFYDSSIAQNSEQRTAVMNIVNNSSGSIPYIVFGPPGTGKTITIVEAILQLKDRKPDSKILVCAPANAACDMLAEKLSEFCAQGELIRVLSETVDMSTIPQRVLQFSNYTKDQRYQKLSGQNLSAYNIVVTTLGLIGRYQDNYEPDIVFIDEAAQASEPEVDCAIGVLKGQQIVLAGDPKQLRPFSSSLVAQKYGFGKSLLERLMDLNIYQNSNSRYITMLKINFRSHIKILQIPNQLFYDGQLRAVSQKAHQDPLSKILIHSIIQKDRNKKLNCKDGQAIEFCNVISQERREGRSPSYYNDKEAETVLDYIRALVHQTNTGQEDIGVVTPYIRQVYKIKALLGRSNFQKVEVGTTETFQGREKRVMIISTVRARHDLLLYDKKYNLGFVTNDKRFNVALTRAKSKLIVIGCAHVLSQDTKWSLFIRLCETLGVCCGAPLAIRTDEVRSDIARKFGHVHMTNEPHKYRGNRPHH